MISYRLWLTAIHAFRWPNGLRSAELSIRRPDAQLDIDAFGQHGASDQLPRLLNRRADAALIVRPGNNHFGREWFLASPCGVVLSVTISVRFAEVQPGGRRHA